MQQKEKKESLFGLYVWLYRKKLLLMLFSDEAYIKYKFKRLTGRYPDLKNPVQFNEKLNCSSFTGGTLCSQPAQTSTRQGITLHLKDSDICSKSSTEFMTIRGRLTLMLCRQLSF